MAGRSVGVFNMYKEVGNLLTIISSLGGMCNGLQPQQPNQVVGILEHILKPTMISLAPVGDPRHLFFLIISLHSRNFHWKHDCSLANTQILSNSTKLACFYVFLKKDKQGQVGCSYIFAWRCSVTWQIFLHGANDPRHKLVYRLGGLLIIDLWKYVTLVIVALFQQV